MIYFKLETYKEYYQLLWKKPNQEIWNVGNLFSDWRDIEKEKLIIKQQNLC